MATFSGALDRLHDLVYGPATKSELVRVGRDAIHEAGEMRRERDELRAQINTMKKSQRQENFQLALIHLPKGGKGAQQIADEALLVALTFEAHGEVGGSDNGNA